MFGSTDKPQNARPLMPVAPPTMEQFRSSIAVALNSDPRRITLEQFRVSPRQRSARCWGVCGGKRFFSKTLLVDPYPVNQRVIAPWRGGSTDIFRTAEEQIDTESKAGDRLRELTGQDCIPAVLGKSAAARTIVWEQLGGTRVGHTVKSARWVNVKNDGMPKALRQAGMWLRRLHQGSAVNDQAIDLENMLQGIRVLMSEESVPAPGPFRAALQLVANAIAKIGSTQLRVPSVLAHGDFMLANLMWDEKLEQVYVVDFENVAAGDACQDLLTMIFDLRSQLLNPLIPKRAMASLEEAFWQGYGPVSKAISLLLSAVASARVLCLHLPRAMARRKEQGASGDVAASLYRTLLDPSMIVGYSTGGQN